MDMGGGDLAIDDDNLYHRTLFSGEVESLPPPTRHSIRREEQQISNKVTITVSYAAVLENIIVSQSRKINQNYNGLCDDAHTE
jgi:hypothetical protein